MEEYLNKYDTLEKKVVFKFDRGSGGIGDLTKFFMYLLKICIENNIKLYCLLSDYSVKTHLYIKYKKMYIETYDLLDPTNISTIDQLINIQPNMWYIIEPGSMYHIDVYKYIEIPLCDVFEFSEDVQQNTKRLTYYRPKYISIHLRMGDRFLETDFKYVMCPDDVRTFDENKLFSFIENNQDKNIFFFCDNNNYKIRIKEKFGFINVIYNDIGHTSLFNTTDLQTFNAITDFSILSNSEHIYKASHSGFSIMASKFKNIPITSL